MTADRDRRIKTLVEDWGLLEEEAAFAVALADGETVGDRRAITFPLPDDQRRRIEEALITQGGFTPAEAARYAAGDHFAIDEVVARRAKSQGSPVDLVLFSA